VAPESRSEAEIRRELEAERQGLAGALDDLKKDARSASRIPAIAGGALLAGMLAAAAVKAARKRHR
jgi:hypothetical protein